MQSFSQALCLFLAAATVVRADLICKTDDDCDGDLHCAVQADGYYTQCVDCSADTFQQQCNSWSPAIVLAAQSSCDATCDARCPEHTDDVCTGTQSCVFDDSWDECLNCADDDSFQSACLGWADDFVLAAQTTCATTCEGRCPAHTDEECDGERVCVTCCEESYDQCVSCDADTYQQECMYWSDEMRDAAAAACSLNCTASDLEAFPTIVAPDADDSKLACTTDDDCEGTLSCVTQADGYYAQCVDCGEASFDSECAYWSGAIVLAAEATCTLNCDARCPGDDTCADPLVCVTQADGFWDGCVDCSEDAFDQQCKYWEEDFKAAAEDACGLTCPAAKKAPKDDGCKTDDDCNGALQCVTQADGFYSTCIDCGADSFVDQCQYWSEAIVTAAEATCAVDCPSRCPGDDTCADPLVCVTQSDGYYSGCTNCTEDAFDKSCAYWGEDFKAAAEEACALVCPTVPTTDDATTAGCKTDDDCNGTLSCVTQADGYYSTCIDCAADSFVDQCQSWSEAIVTAAEATCATDCPSRCPGDGTCADPLVCVTQSDGYYSGCTNCTEDAFDQSCAYWSDDFKAAAEEACALTCP